MATLTVKLNEDTLRRLMEAARRAGVTPERLAEMTLESLLLDDSGVRKPDGVSEPASAWVEEAAAGDVAQGRRTAPSDYEGPFVELPDALDAFSAELERRLASRAG